MGKKTYQLTDHLGSITAVISDRKVAIEDPLNPGIVLRYQPQILSFSDYFPFGAQKNNRNGSVGIGYRHGFNGMEKDNELKGNGNSYNFGARIYDPRVPHFLSIDPMFHQREWLSPYNFVQNNPINRTDPTGALDTWYVDGNDKVLLHTNDGSNDVVRVSDDKIADFKKHAELYSNSKGVYNSKGWNSYWKSEFSLSDKQLSQKQINHLDRLNSDWSRENAVEFWLNPSIGSSAKASFSEALSQWTNPQLVATGALMAASIRPRGNMKTTKDGLPSKVFSSKAPRQVTPGIKQLSGQHMDDLGRVQPWKATYDKYGRMIERTDWNAANKTQWN